MKFDLLLVKALKGLVFVVFTFMVLVYFGILLLLPLDILTQLVKILHGIGLPTVIALAGGLGAVGYAGKRIHDQAELYKLLIDIGMELVNFGNAQVKRFDALISNLEEKLA